MMRGKRRLTTDYERVAAGKTSRSLLTELSYPKPSFRCSGIVFVCGGTPMSEAPDARRELIGSRSSDGQPVAAPNVQAATRELRSYEYESFKLRATKLGPPVTLPGYYIGVINIRGPESFLPPATRCLCSSLVTGHAQGSHVIATALNSSGFTLFLPNSLCTNKA